MKEEKYTNEVFCIEAWGGYACFTRPEMKVERVSYDVITPSACRAIFQAIFWKPAIKWNIRRIDVLNPIKWASIRRNEVGAVAGKGTRQIFIEDNRQQRAGLILQDVRYRIFAELEFIHPRNRPKTLSETPESLADSEEKKLFSKDENPGKYNAIFLRRASKGQCFTTPYFGCREFSANFKLIERGADGNFMTDSAPISDTRDLGFMLYDMDFSKPENPVPMFYRAKLENGSINVPSAESDEVLK